MGKCPYKKEERGGIIFVWSPSTIIKLLLLLFFVNMCFFLQLIMSSIWKTTDHFHCIESSSIYPQV